VSYNVNNLVLFIFFSAAKFFADWPEGFAMSWHFWHKDTENPAEPICFPFLI
jgi:hypothetical protein